MAENRFAKFKATAPSAPSGGNRFAKFANPAVAQPEPLPAPVSAAGKGDMPMTAGQTAMDVAKSAGTGLVQGVIGLGA